MSLYIGKDTTTNKNKLVISKAEMSLVEMANSSSLNNNIVFNSLLPYVTVDLFVNSAPPYYSTSSAYVYYMDFTVEEWAKISTKFLLITLGGVSIICSSKPYPSYASVGDYGAYGGLSSYELDFTNRRLLIFVPPAAYSNMVVTVLPYNNDGSISAQDDLGGEVTIGNNNMTFNGIDIFRKKFIVKGSINASDSIFTYKGISFQIVNSTTPTDNGLTISSSPTETKVTYGGKVVLTSLGAYLPLLQSDGFTILTYSNYYTTSPLTGFTLSVNSIYYMALTYTFQTTSGPVTNTYSFLGKADSLWYNDNLFVVPAENFGSCLGINQKRLNATSLEINYQIVTCSGGGGPTLSWSTGPYEVTLKYKKLIDST